VANGTILVAGAVARRPRRGGHAWVFLQYLIGLKRLGWDVLFLDRIEPAACVDASGRTCAPERSENVRYLHGVMGRFGLAHAWSLSVDSQVFGVTRQRVLERARDAAFLLNVMGYYDDDEVLGRVGRRVFLDIDPGFGQMWHELGLADVFRGHDDFVTIGENIGTAACSIPTTARTWITTPQPVVREHWETPPLPAANDRPFTSVVSWRGPNGPIAFGERTYGLRVHEFRRFAELPHESRDHFEVALDIDSADRPDRDMLESNGWLLHDPLEVAGDPDRYRDFVHGSAAEFMVAKNLYVDTHSGWISDRSLCYLASGRPVLMQDTGIGERYPTGTGLVTFRTRAEAAAGVQSIRGDYARHARAARDIAAEFFDARLVLGRLVSRLGVA
jgi:hypothetical protein